MKKLLMVGLVLVLAVASTVVSAQGDIYESPTTFEDLSGVYISEFAAGTLTDNGDGSFSLALDGLAENTKNVTTTPWQSVDRINSQLLYRAWIALADAPALGASLETEGFIAQLTLTTPAFDGDTLTFSAEVAGINTFGDDKVDTEFFDESSLYLTYDNTLAQAIAEGYVMLSEGVRSGAAAVTAIDYTVQMLPAINRDRCARGLTPAVHNPALFAAASRHSIDMANRGVVSHTGSDGSQPSTRVDAVYAWMIVAENVAAGQPDVASAYAAWWNSPGHQANMLLPDLGNGMAYEFAVAYSFNPNVGYDGHYWTMVIAQPLEGGVPAGAC